MTPATFDALRRRYINEPEENVYARSVEALKERPQDVLSRDSLGNTLLHRVVNYKWLNVARLLIEHGADVNAKNKDGQTSLHRATIPLDPSFKQDLALLKLLLLSGADPNAQDNKGNTPLFELGFIFAPKREKALLECLLDFGADPLIINNDLQTPLHRISTKAGAEIMLQFPIDINARDNEKRTPLMTIIEGGENEKLVEFLCQKGADVNAVDKEGNCPLHYVCKDFTSDVNLLRLLLRFGANPNTANLIGQTPLHKAVWTHFDRGIKVLLEAGADRNIRDIVGNSALDLAEEGYYNGFTPYYAPPPHGDAIYERPFRIRQRRIIKMLTQ